MFTSNHGMSYNLVISLILFGDSVFLKENCGPFNKIRIYIKQTFTFMKYQGKIVIHKPNKLHMYV